MYVTYVCIHNINLCSQLSSYVDAQENASHIQVSVAPMVFHFNIKTNPSTL